jgi:hypothetical protein
MGETRRKFDRDFREGAVRLVRETARRNGNQAGAKIRLLHADIAGPDTAELGVGYTLLLDFGCLHGLPDRSFQRAAAAITSAARPGAVLLMFAFASAAAARRRGDIDPARIPALFPQWDLTFSRPASEVPLRGPMRNARPSWYQLVRR